MMDVPKVKSCEKLTVYAADRDYWKARVKCMRQLAVNVKLGSHVVEGWVDNIHKNLLNPCCSGAEDAVITTSISVACTHHNTTTNQSAHTTRLVGCVYHTVSFVVVLCCVHVTLMAVAMPVYSAMGKLKLLKL